MEGSHSDAGDELERCGACTAGRWTEREVVVDPLSALLTVHAWPFTAPPQMSLSALSQSVRALSLSSRALRTFASSSSAPIEPEATPTPAPAAQHQWTPQTQRTGVLARKEGMTCLWSEDGIRIPVTVLHVSFPRPPHAHETRVFLAEHHSTRSSTTCRSSLPTRTRPLPPPLPTTPSPSGAPRAA